MKREIMSDAVLERLVEEDGFHRLAMEHEGEFVPSYRNFDSFTLYYFSPNAVIIRPNSKSDSDIAITSGVHGSETLPIEQNSRLVSRIARGEIEVKQKTLIMNVNIAAMRQGVREVERNANREFNRFMTAVTRSVDGQAARDAMKVINYFFDQPLTSLDARRTYRTRIHFDLHDSMRTCAVDNPKFAINPAIRHGRVYHTGMLKFLADCDIGSVLFSREEASTLSSYTSRVYGADAYTLELGETKPFGQNDLSTIEKFDQALTSLLEDRYQIDTDDSNNDLGIDLYEEVKPLTRTHESLRFGRTTKDPNFSPIDNGEVLIYDGDTPHYTAQGETVLLFGNPNVKVGDRFGIEARKTDSLPTYRLER